MRRLVGLVALVGVGVGSACLGFVDTDDCAYGGCGDGGTATTDTKVPVPDVLVDAKPDGDPLPPDCLTPTEPLKNPEKCLVDSFGVFVAPSGADEGGNGTKAKPFKTIAKALEANRSRIVVCEGEYPESVDVGRAVEIYSGVTCDWAKAGNKAKITASKAAYGLKVAKVAGAVVLADLEVVGMDGAAPSESSVGVFVSESANVLQRPQIREGQT